MPFLGTNFKLSLTFNHELRRCSQKPPCVQNLQIMNEQRVGIKTTLYIESEKRKKKSPMKPQLLYSYKCLPFCYLHICSLEWIKKMTNIWRIKEIPQTLQLHRHTQAYSADDTEIIIKKRKEREKVIRTLRLLPISHVTSSLFGDVDSPVNCNILIHDDQRSTDPTYTQTRHGRIWNAPSWKRFS